MLLASITKSGKLFQTIGLQVEGSIIYIQGSVVTQTTLGGLTIYHPVANFL